MIAEITEKVQVCGGNRLFKFDLLGVISPEIPKGTFKATNLHLFSGLEWKLGNIWVVVFRKKRPEMYI